MLQVGVHVVLLLVHLVHLVVQVVPLVLQHGMPVVVQTLVLPCMIPRLLNTDAKHTL